MIWNFHKMKYPKNKMKSESELLDLMDEICVVDIFNRLAKQI